MSSSRMKWMAVPLAALFATGCTDDVEQQESGTSVRSTFDADRGLIPTPNDLALQAAIAQPAGATRTALMNAINAGGFPGGAPNPLNVINVPFEFIVDGVATTATVGIDPSTINSTTVAIVRVSGTGAPARIDPTVVGTAAGAVQVFPQTGYAAGTRYVAAVRGGSSGVKTADGRSLAASSPIYLIANEVNLTDPDTRPSSLTPEQAEDLADLQGLLSNPVDWTKFTVPAICAAIFGLPESAFPESLCWAPLVAGVPGAPGTPPAADALSAIELAFPATEAISIQTFEIAP